MNYTDYILKYQEDRFFNEVFSDNIYNLSLTVVDVGALAGEFSFWIAPFAKQVYAIEPNSSHFKELESNISDFGFKNVIPYNIGLSDNDGEDSLNLLGRGAGDLAKHQGSGNDREVVIIKTLPTFMTENSIDHIDIFKIDIEGGEENVFAGMGDALSKIDLIIGEHLEGLKPMLFSRNFIMEKGTEHNLIFKRQK